MLHSLLRKLKMPFEFSVFRIEPPATGVRIQVISPPPFDRDSEGRRIPRVQKWCRLEVVLFRRNPAGDPADLPGIRLPRKSLSRGLAGGGHRCR